MSNPVDVGFVPDTQTQDFGFVPETSKDFGFTPDPTPLSLESQLQAEKKAKEDQSKATELAQQQAAQAAADPKNWTLEQTKQHFKENPPASIQEEAFAQNLIQTKKDQIKQVTDTLTGQPPEPQPPTPAEHPKDWTLGQTQEHIKQNPPSTVAQEISQNLLLEKKKHEVRQEGVSALAQFTRNFLRHSPLEEINTAQYILDNKDKIPPPIKDESWDAYNKRFQEALQLAQREKDIASKGTIAQLDGLMMAGLTVTGAEAPIKVVKRLAAFTGVDKLADSLGVNAMIKKIPNATAKDVLDVIKFGVEGLLTGGVTGDFQSWRAKQGVKEKVPETTNPPETKPTETAPTQTPTETPQPVETAPVETPPSAQGLDVGFVPDAQVQIPAPTETTQLTPSERPPEDHQILTQLRDYIGNVEGQQLGGVKGDQNRQWLASGVPEFLRGKGYTHKGILKLFDKAINGENLSPAGDAYVNRAIDWFKKQTAPSDVTTPPERTVGGWTAGINDESGHILIPPVDEYLKKSTETLPVSKDMEQGFTELKTQSAADELRARQLLEQVKISPKDAETIYHHQEDPTVPLTPEQQKIYDGAIKPLADKSAELFSKLRNEGIPVQSEGYTPRFIAGKGNMLDRLQSGIQKIGSSGSGLFKKTSGSFKERVMKAITDEQGNKKIVAIKGGRVTEFVDGQPNDLGPLERNLPTPIKEHFDPAVMGKLEQVAKDLGIEHTRKINIGGKRTGYSVTGANEIVTKAASPDSILAHEIGHQIDDRYGLQKMMFGSSRPQADFILDKMIGKATREGRMEDVAKMQEQKVRNKELRDLADARGQRPAYARKGEEKMAVMFESLIHAPDVFKEAAPTTYKFFTDFLKSKPELKPLLDIKPSLHIDAQVIGDENVPGVFVDKFGKKWNIGEATTKQIEANTDLTYHKNALLNNLIHYNELRKIDRATEYLNNIKENPDFQKFAMKIGEGNPPEGWKMTALPQFRNYYLEPRIADAFDHFNRQLYKGSDPLPVLTSLNRFLRTSIFFNPLIHIPNIATHWAVNRGSLAWGNPKAYVTLFKTGSRAIEAVMHQNEDYLKMLDSGVNLMYHNQTGNTLAELMTKKMGEELSGDQQLLEKIKSSVGAVNPYNISGKMTWATNDIATMQAIYERMAKGEDINTAIDHVSKHIPNYIIPSRVLNSRALSNIMTNPNITMFGAYHYGALKSYGEMTKSLLGNVPMSERLDAADKLAALGLLAFVVYPQLDNVAKQLTGNKDAHLRRAGPTTFPENINKLAKGQIDFSQALQSVLTPAVGLKEGVELATNRDLFTGQKIIHGGHVIEGIKDLAVKSIAPLNAVARITDNKISLSDYLYQLAGIQMTDPNKGKFYNMKDSKDSYQQEFDKEYAKNPQRALNDAYRFNRNQVNDLKQIMKEKGIKDVPQSIVNEFIITSTKTPTAPKNLDQLLQRNKPVRREKIQSLRQSIK